MSVSSEISRLTGLRNSIRTKLIVLGILSSSTADLDDCATGIDGITAKGATTYTPGTSNQTISSGQYLTGTQTISGDANLVAGNIKSGVSIFGVSGTYAGGSTVIVETPDSHGGTVIEITGVDLSGDTVAADKLLYGYTAHDSTGTAIIGTYQGTTPTLQDKTVSPSESQQVVTADSPTYDALNSVTVNAISSSYVGSGITRRSSTDLSESGGTITAPAGYYSSDATKTVAAMTDQEIQAAVNTGWYGNQN